MTSKSGQVKVVGRFPAGEIVALVKVAGEHVLRAAGGQTITRKKVDENGEVLFDKDVELGARYFVTGYADGRPVEVRATGITEDDASELRQAPIGPDVRKFAGGGEIPAVVSGASEDDDKPRKRAGESRQTDKSAPLAGKALKDRAKELGVEKVSTKTADQLRAAVARKEKAAA